MALWKIKSVVWIKINCALTAVIVILLAIHTYNQFSQEVHPAAVFKGFSICCAFPCKNGGVCSSDGSTYTCECKDTNYYGKNCELSTWFTKIKQWYHSKVYDNRFLTYKFGMFWKVVNSFSSMQSEFNSKLLGANKALDEAGLKWNVKSEYFIGDAYHNTSITPRTLPPIPKNCPTPMGLSGPFKLPEINTLYNRVLKRIRFKPCPVGTNIFFGAFAQHFLSQFNDYNWLYSDNSDRVDNLLDMSHVYGQDQGERLALRSFRNGRLKSKVINGEEFPPTLDRCLRMAKNIKPNAFVKKSDMSYIEPKWAIGNPALGLQPMLFILSTIWLREHNRVCEKLLQEHESWSDEQIYQTARVIVTGEAIKIMITEYLQHFTQYQLKLMYKPELIHELETHYLGQVPQELFYLPLWQTFIPDEIVINEKKYNINTLSYTSEKMVFEHGLGNFIQAMTHQRAGEFISNNIGKAALHEIKQLIKQTRDMRLQSYNNYRRKFNLIPLESFEELTGDLYLSSILKELYIDIDAVEFVVGLLLEEKSSEEVVPPTMLKMSSYWLMKSLMSHPINSPKWWKPNTFGGITGFNIVKDATLQSLICLNVKEKCQSIYVNFKIPNELQYL